VHANKNRILIRVVRSWLRAVIKIEAVNAKFDKLIVLYQKRLNEAKKVFSTI